jgi:aryl sulfotransferase
MESGMPKTARRPEVRHVYQNHHLDATRWDGFETRPDDIVVSTAYKAGTTLVQTIVANLIFADGDLPGPVLGFSPWLDMRIMPLEEAKALLGGQAHRRCIKTHLPLDGLPFHDHVKYIVVGRDPRDVFMSLLNHWGSHTPLAYEMLNDTPGRVGPEFPHFSGDMHALWRQWITRGWFPWEADGYPYWSLLHHAKTWWEFRHLPNVGLVHYSDLRADLAGQMRGLAAYLDIEVPESLWPRVVHACEFDTVKADPYKVVDEMHDSVFQGGGDTFIHKGTNGRWKDVLDDDEIALYEQAMAKTLSPDCARWLEEGGAYL